MAKYKTMSGADYIAATLERYGVTHVFVVPTILTQTLISMDEKTSIERVVAHSEAGAAYMADGYARVAGHIGVCGAQNVGRANLAAALQDPFLGGSPVLALTGGPVPSSLGRHFYQEIDAFPMFKPVTKSSVKLETISRLAHVLQQAVRDATTGRPGPAHIELEGHAGEGIDSAEFEFDDYIDSSVGTIPPFRPHPDPHQVRKALAAILAAERPMIVAGGGVRSSRASSELIAFAEAHSIPVATSMNAKEVIPSNHPLSVGVVGLYSRKQANIALSEADLVIFIGSQTSSQVTLNWKIPTIDTQIVHIDIDAAELGRHYHHTIPVLGDALVCLAALRAAGGTAKKNDAWRARVTALGAQFYTENADVLRSDQVPLRPERLIAELGAVLPDNAVVVADTGHAGMWTAGMLDLDKPGQGFIRAAGSLGWGLPAAIGAQLGAPDKAVVLFIGDGGLWYHLGELETAVRWNVPLIIVVNNNHSLNQEVRPYARAYGGELRGRHHELWHFEKVDFAAVAENMGATGIRVTKPSEFASAMARAVEAKGPVVIDVISDRDALAPLGFDPAA
jgi:acetolactate synthase-1/2/3 large subunit